jgi:hypothetical protein
MKSKALLAALLALFVGSCSCLMPLAAAASQQDHSCCPSQKSPEKASDCCLRPALPAHTVSVAAPQFHLIGLAHVAPGPITQAQQVLRLDSAALSPPGDPVVFSRSSRAPPSLLA